MSQGDEGTRFDRVKVAPSASDMRLLRALTIAEMLNQYGRSQGQDGMVLAGTRL